MTPQFAAGIFSLFGAIFFFGAGFFFAKHRLSFDQDKLESEIRAGREREEALREKALQDEIDFKEKSDQQKLKNDTIRKNSHKQVAELKEQIGRLNSVLGDYQARLEDLAIEVTRVDAEKILLNEALEDTKKDLKDISALEQENQEMAEKLKFLNNQLKEFDRLREEKILLTEKVSELETSKKRDKALNAEDGAGDRVEASSLAEPAGS